MKHCPQCAETFSDEYNFCLNDGTTLVNESDPEKTIPFSIPLETIQTQQRVPTQDIPTEKFQTAPVTENISKNNSSKWVFMLIGILAAALATTVFILFYSADKNPISLTATENTVLSPNGDWTGDWNTEKTSYMATAKFNEQNGEVSGQIVWTLKQTTNPKKIDKIGTSAVEYVEGKFDPQTKLLTFNGVRKDDPNGIIILDKYNMSLAENNQTLMGVSINGKFILKR